MVFMGLQHTIDWVAHGTVPPHADYIAVDNDLSDGTRVALDQFGNALGGVRTTYLDVPINRYTIPNTGPGLCSQTGWQTRLPDATLGALYKNAGNYASLVHERLNELVAQGWFPREYVHYVESDLSDFIRE
jgi:hypothetical protein